MSAVTKIERGEIDSRIVLDAENLEPLYDTELVNSLDPELELPLELRKYIPFMPVVKESDETSYIPFRDFKSPQSFMGLLVSKSQIVDGLFVADLVPLYPNVPYPNRLKSMYGRYNPGSQIFGFLLGEGGMIRQPDMAVLTKDTEEQAVAKRLPRSILSISVARLLLRECSKAERKNNQRLLES